MPECYDSFNIPVHRTGVDKTQTARAPSLMNAAIFSNVPGRVS